MTEKWLSMFHIDLGIGFKIIDWYRKNEKFPLVTSQDTKLSRDVTQHTSQTYYHEKQDVKKK